MYYPDGMKFPDLIHAVKPEPATEIPQGQSAHDSFWDFISLMPESTHMIAWQLSDRTIPRSYRMMQGPLIFIVMFVLRSLPIRRIRCKYFRSGER